METANAELPKLNRKDPDKISQQQKRQPPAVNNSTNPFAKKYKHDFKSSRKRSQSFTGSGKLFLFKRRKKESTLPTKFLLGGNICDPLNLNSLQDEEINRAMNAVTPKSSPLPTPPRKRGQIGIIIPPNIRDPLNLIDYTDDATYEKQLTSPIKRNRKKNHRNKKRTSTTSISESTENNNKTDGTDVAAAVSTGDDMAKTPEKCESAHVPVEAAVVPNPPDKPIENKITEKVARNLSLELQPEVGSFELVASIAVVDKDKKDVGSIKNNKRKSTDEGKDVKKVRRLDSMDKIVSPVIPQPGAWKRPPNFIRNGKLNNRVKQSTAPEKMPTFNDKNKKYQYGNYNRYYGYRNPHHDVDVRLRCFAAHRGMFFGKDVLDIGCNIGHITLSIARDFCAKSVVGLDIDKKLINIARKNVCYYVNCSSEDADGEGIPRLVNKRGKKSNEKFFPISMPILYGPVEMPGLTKIHKAKGFPHNVAFVQGNYVLEDENLINLETPQFDIILALSITKWIHLNWGDSGIKQAFRRMYAQLRPGGRLILEPQAWSSYLKKKALTETIFQNYKSIEFLPQCFTQFLLSSEVGFAKSEVMGCPVHHSKGFQRPILVFTKSNLSPIYSQQSSDRSITPSYNTLINGAYINKRVYTNIQESPAATTTSLDGSKTGDEIEPTLEQSDNISLQESATPTSLDALKTVDDNENSREQSDVTMELSDQNNSLQASVTPTSLDTVKTVDENSSEPIGEASDVTMESSDQNNSLQASVTPNSFDAVKTVNENSSEQLDEASGVTMESSDQNISLQASVTPSSPDALKSVNENSIDSIEEASNVPMVSSDLSDLIKVVEKEDSTNTPTVTKNPDKNDLGDT